MDSQKNSSSEKENSSVPSNLKNRQELKTSVDICLLDHIQSILNISEKSEVYEDILKDGEVHLNHMAKKLKITPVDALIFSHIVAEGDDGWIFPNELKNSLRCSSIQIIKHLDNFDALEKRKLIVKRRAREKNKKCYQVPSEVILALRNNKVPGRPQKQKLDIYQFFGELEVLFETSLAEGLDLSDHVEGLRNLMDNNLHLIICQAFNAYRLDNLSLALLSLFVNMYVNENDEDVDFDDINRMVDDKSIFSRIKHRLVSQREPLLKKGLIENSFDEKFGSRQEFTLTSKAKTEFLSELDLQQKTAKLKKGLILSSNITAKAMYYNSKEKSQIDELASLLQPDNFKAVQKRLAKKGLRKGFACLFHGEPGTGKTETVNQLARLVGRDIMLVDIAATKSCWFGESEKLIKKLFDQYRAYVKANEIAPILLFNEADAIIGKRKDVERGNVAQTENTIQNIILQEMENLEGIMIATTNLTRNLDGAFERRFLYKIKFEKPSLEAKASIWKSQLPELSDKDVAVLAETFDFSGGQIENIARRRIVDNILHGGKVKLETLLEYCREEKLEGEQKQTIGFAGKMPQL